jgi:hypothetical protein
LPQARFDLPKWCVGVWVIAGLLLVVLNFRGAGSFTPYEWGNRVGRTVVFLLVPWVFAWIAWMAGRRAKGMAPFVFVCILAFALLADLGQQAGDNGAVEEAGRKIKEQMDAATANFQKAVTDAKFSTMLDAAQYTDRGKIAASRAGLLRAKAANAELRKVMAGREAAFKAELERAGASGAAEEQALTGFRKGQGNKLELVLKIRDDEDQMETKALELLDLLDAQWGHWHAVAGEGIGFDDPVERANYNEHIKAVQAIAAEQAEYQKQVATEMAK